MLGHHVTIHSPNLSNGCDDNGLLFAAECPSKNDSPSKCFDTNLKKICFHNVRKVSLCQLGQYVFPSRWWHKGYYTINSGLMYITAQLFYTTAICIDSSSGHTRTHNMSMKQGNVTMEQMIRVSDDLYNNWDSTYSNSRFSPSKAHTNPFGIITN